MSKNKGQNKKLIVMLSAYNGERYLEEQLRSIWQQDTPCDIELLVRDDGSRDDTLEIFHLWEDRLHIRYIKDNESLGAAKSFWRLLQNAPEADYYAFADQDDIWDNNKISSSLEAIGCTDAPVMWFSNCRIVDYGGNVIKDKKHEARPVLTIPSQLVCGSAQGCAMVFNRAACQYLTASPIKEIPMHDIVAMTYILAAGKVIYEDAPLFSYRVHDNNAVAKEGKTVIKRMSDTLISWFGDRNRGMISRFARQIVKDNRAFLSKETILYLEALQRCRFGLKSKLNIINHHLTTSTNKRALRSFRIRIILGVV